jgi:hypothetical protein
MNCPASSEHDRIGQPEQRDPETDREDDDRSEIAWGSPTRRPTVFCGSGGLRYELVEIGVDGVLRERGLHFKNVRLQLLAYCGARWPGHSPVAVNGAASRMMPADVHDADEQIHAL